MHGSLHCATHVTRTTPNTQQEIPWKNHMYLDQLVDGGVRRSVQTCICTCVVTCGHVTECPILRSVQTGVYVSSPACLQESLLWSINWGHQVVLHLLQLSSGSSLDPADYEARSNAYSVPGSLAEPWCSLVSIHKGTCQHIACTRLKWIMLKWMKVKMNQLILNNVYKLAIYHKWFI